MADLVPGQDVSFEDALAQLETLVARLEEGQLPLAEAVENYERGMGLAAYCTDLLDSAELRIRQVDTATADESARDGAYDLQEQINLLLFEEE
jgi:exodeoxyribonuclease VII small subunit